ncbi:unnamed protein product, partial [Mesorhabditis belari]|uniref:Uncharacterized protein n=1 Tax=Mesorhabditis belari TaxID=2138241 RepID=A0AAF3FL44_9BILA
MRVFLELAGFYKDEVSQVLTTNLWLELQWFDYRLSWDPSKMGGLRKLHVPSDQIWTPDLVLYNNADGEPQITIVSDALVYFNGLVIWKPPSIYKSFCEINIEYFPYDKQSCKMKFGGWTYTGMQMDVRQLAPYDGQISRILTEKNVPGHYVEIGMDLSSYYPSEEWDLMSLNSTRHVEQYPGCCGYESYIDVTFVFVLRRKTLFYTINLVIPSMMISVLTIFCFYIPPIEHKISFTISIFVALTVYYLVLNEILPPTSLVVPLIGKYLLLTLFNVGFSINFSVISINYFRRDGSQHPMPHWMKVVFVKTLPKYLWIQSPSEDEQSDDGSSTSDIPQGMFDGSRRPSPYFLTIPQDGQMRLSQLAQLRGMHPDLIRRMIDNLSFISDHFRAKKKEDQVSGDWAYVAFVMDRILLIIYILSNIGAGLLLLWGAETIFDTREPMPVTPGLKPLSGDTFESVSENFTQDVWLGDTTIYY